MKRWRWMLVAFAVVPQIVYWPILHPRHTRRLDELERQVHEISLRVESARAAKKKIEQFRDEVRRLPLELEKLGTILPPAVSGDDLWTAVDTKADQTGVRIQRVDLRTLEDRQTHGMLPAEVEITGSADEVLNFFRGLQNYHLITFVSHLTCERVGPFEWRTTFLLRIAVDQARSEARS